MAIVILGCVILAICIFNLRFPQLAELLKSSAPETWRKLGSPSGYSFADLGNTISLYNWVLSRKFEDSENTAILITGERAFSKARRVKCGILTGIVLIITGFLFVLGQTVF
ncbi:hypothetical protein [Microbulbifer variabilis]|uniref:hypothetical protein n=1 Tax=Microbulbifer variabilis TaxID=266805 RepID=UPI001CFD2701|nr:hypothetical protein [Microbulbifer variabilis]